MMKIKSFILLLIFLIFSGTVSAQKLLPFSDLKGDKFSLFLESRDNPIQFNDSIYSSWVKGETPQFKASKGEIYIYQLAVCALDEIKDVKLSFSDLKSGKSVISKNRMVCYNITGVDIMGKPFTKNISVDKNHLQALWIGVDLQDVEPGNYTGTLSVTADAVSKEIPVSISVDDKNVENHGYNEGWRLSRLNWLNCTIGHDNKVTKGYSPVTRSGDTFSILGRSVKIGDSGLPLEIDTFFTGSNESIKEESEPVISSPLEFIVETADGKEVFKHSKISYVENGEAETSWTLKSKSKNFEISTYGRLEFDGFMRYELTLKAKKDCKIKDAKLQTTFTKEKSKYLMGLGIEGGLRKDNISWKWDTTKNQDMIWIGGVNGGVRFKLMDQNYRRPLVNVYYSYGSLFEPLSWCNHGKGGITTSDSQGNLLFNAYSGEREVKSGEELHYIFELLITPFRTINHDVMYSDRYFHGGGTEERSKIRQATAAGANIINLHHASDLYPFINYPYLDENLQALKDVVDDAHKAGKRMKFYYTTREITKNIPEFWAVNSLNGEVIFPGPGNNAKSVVNPNGPNEWLIKNLREKYIAAWYAHVDRGIFKGAVDLSVITTPDSRLNNFYIGGLDMMVQKMGLDGVYIDDSALDRYTIRRARKVIDAYRPEGRMDLHSWNHLNKHAGYASCLNMYMDLLPYFDLCWIGEGRDYNHPTDNWLIEVSGIPFGLTGQMLEGGGNPWRGMVYGITNRSGYNGKALSPTVLWNFWDKYQMKTSEMIGYWDEGCPVKSDNPNVAATFYLGNDYSVIAVAAWGDEDQTVRLNMDEYPYYTKIYQPEIPGFQPAVNVIDFKKPITIPKGKGFLFVIEN